MRVELASGRKLRDRNKPAYRLAHWPIWIFVFFIAPGPSTFDLFERGFDRRKLLWLGLLLIVINIIFGILNIRERTTTYTEDEIGMPFHQRFKGDFVSACDELTQ